MMPSLLPTLMNHPCVMAIPLPTILPKAKSKVPCGFRVTSNDGDRGGSWPNKAGRTEKSTCSKATAMDASLNPQIGGVMRNYAA